MNIRKMIITSIVGVVALSANAEDTFFIENFTIGAGETKELALNFTNELTYTAFQADIYLPEGLEFVYNDTEYGYSWPNYSRVNFRTHTWSSELQTGNGLRILCYSNTNSLLTGNEGALMYISVKASSDFIGNHQMSVTGKIFTEMDSENNPIKHEFADTYTTVTGPSAEPDGIPLTLQMANSKGEVNMYVAESSVQAFKFVADEGYVLHSVTFNGTDVTESVNSYNVYRTPAITEASTLNVTFEVATGVEEVVSSDRVKVTASNGVIRVNGTVSGENVGLYTSTGVQANFVVSNGDEIEFTATPGTVYIVKTANRTVKVVM